MRYVSAEWHHDEMMDSYTIWATGDDGETYFVPSADSTVPPWPEYLAEGGTITGTPPPTTKD